MNYAIVLAAGVGQRMRNGGMPKQFLKLMGKPIIVYTLEKFEECEDIDKIVIVCHASYISHMQELLRLYALGKVASVIVGGADRQSSCRRGLEAVRGLGGADDDIVVIHDGVRPLVSQTTLRENVRVAAMYGSAVTVHPVTESVVITGEDEVEMGDFKKRSDTYSLTAPQSFRLGEIEAAYSGAAIGKHGETGKLGARSTTGDEAAVIAAECRGAATTECDATAAIPLLDAAMVYANAGGKVHIVKEQGVNIKITTPEDYYYLKAILELEENKFVFGL